MDTDHAHLDEMGYRVHTLTHRYTGGDQPVGAPAYQENGMVAYSPEQAQIIFKNLLTAKLDGKIIPFIDVMSDSGSCARRRDAMMKHMMYCQHIDPRSIGVAIVQYSDKKEQKMVDYLGEIAQQLDNQTVQDTPEFAAAFTFHTAPTIKVVKDGVITNLVLDPSLCAEPATLQQWKSTQMRKADVFFLDWGKRETSTTDKIEKIGENGLSQSFNAAPNEKLVELAHDIRVTTLEEFRKDQELTDFSIDAFMYQSAYTGFENEAFQSGQETHTQLVALAQEKGIKDLPNCGPLALRAIRKALGISKAGA